MAERITVRLWVQTSVQRFVAYPRQIRLRWRHRIIPSSDRPTISRVFRIIKLRKGADNNFTLNSNGIANINLKGLSSFGWRNTWDINASFDGTWAAGGLTRFDTVQSSSAGTAYDPYLEVVWTTGTVRQPVAAFSGNPTTGTAPLKVTFTDSSTGSVTTRTWQYKLTSASTWTTFTLDGSNAFTFSNPGTYDVQLTVSGPGGSNTKTITSYITVDAAPVAPVAAFSGIQQPAQHH